MIIRNASAVGQFYPRSSGDIESMLNKFMRRAEVKKKEVSGIVSPHAGYIYCGETQAHVYKSILQDNPTFVIVGPDHRKSGNDAIMTAGIWKTPLGNCRIDSNLAESIFKNSNYLKDDYTAFSQEHSIEVQLPWLQYKFNKVNIVPISISNQDLETSEDIGNAIKRAAVESDEQIIVIASSDFTHFGTSYGYKPVSGGVSRTLDFIQSIDKEAADNITKLRPEAFIDTVEKYDATICGIGAINTMLFSVMENAKKGELLHYSTSYDVSNSLESIVGYCGIIIETGM